VQTQYVINSGALNCLLGLLNSSKKSIRKEACWTISNITAGNKDQISAVIEANIIPPLIMVLTNADFDVKKEAAWAISNATSGGSPQQIKYLVAQGCIEPLCNLLSVHDNRIVSVALEGLENILRVGEKEKETAQSDQNEFARLVEAAGGLDRIEALQQHTNQEVYEKAVRLLEVFFAADEEEDIEGLAPQTTGNQFGFGVQTAPDGGFNFGGASATDSSPFGSQPTPPEPRW
jgi:importin subunit alpha-6/7